MTKYSPFEKAIMKVIKEKLDKTTTELVNNDQYIEAFVTSFASYKIENEFGL